MKRAAALALVLVLAGCSSDDVAAGDALACSDFYELAEDANAGVTTDAEIRERVRSIYDEAKTGSGGLVTAAAEMTRAANDGEDFAFERAVDRMDAACSALAG